METKSMQANVGVKLKLIKGMDFLADISIIEEEWEYGNKLNILSNVDVN